MFSFLFLCFALCAFQAADQRGAIQDLTRALVLGNVPVDVAKSLNSKIEMASNKALKRTLSVLFPSWLGFMSVVGSQRIFPGFMAYKVGKALLVLAYRGRAFAYVTSDLGFKLADFKEAIEILLGPKGSENLRCFETALTFTVKRLASYIRKFAIIVEARFTADWYSCTGFFEADPTKRKAVIRIASPHGILIPFVVEEVQDSENRKNF